MRLLHPEIEIIPGRKGAYPQATPYVEGVPLAGSAVLRLQNASPRINAYKVSVRCDAPFWKDDWYTLTALPPPPGAQDALLQSHKDIYDRNKRWVTTHLSGGGTRDVLIQFDLKSHPNSRAGRYVFYIVVETKVIGETDTTRYKDRVTEIPAVAIVRPFYKWSVGMKSARSKPFVSMRKRAVDFELSVLNQGNDWLYCDVKVPTAQNLKVEAPTLRMAVRPPEWEETVAVVGTTETLSGTQRSVPVRAITGLRNLRGNPIDQPIQLTVVRQDAPSIPPPPDSPNYTGHGAVVAAPTTEIQSPPDAPKVVYHPPIPEKLIQLPMRMFGSVRTMFMALVGFMLIFPLMVAGYQRIIYQDMKISALEANIQAGTTIKVRGKLLRGAQFQIIDAKKGNEDYISGHLESKPETALPNASGEDVMLVSIPKDADTAHGKLIARRFVKWIPLPFLFPASLPVPIQVGRPLVEAKVTGMEPKTLSPGQKVVITGEGLTDAKVLLNDNPWKKEASSSDIQVIVAAPDCDKFPCQVQVNLSVKDKTIPAGLLTINQPTESTPPPNAMGDTGGGPPAPAPVADTPASGGSGGGGGGSSTTAQNQTTPPVQQPPAQTTPTTPKPPAGPNWTLAAQARKAFEDSKITPQGVNYSHAQAVAEKILKTDPDNPVAMAVKGYALSKVKGQEGVALETLQNALKLFHQYNRDQSSDAYIANMGIGVLYKNGNAGDDKSPAAGYLEAAAKLNPNSGLAQFNLAYWYVESGNKDAARLPANKARDSGSIPKVLLDGLYQDIGP